MKTFPRLITFSLLLLALLLTACQSAPPAETQAPDTPASLPTEAPPVVTETSSAPSDLEATLHEVTGEVESRQLGADFVPAAEGEELQEQGQVRTLESGSTRIDLSTGTIIRMAASSHFTLESSEPEGESFLTRISLEIGQLWIILQSGTVEVDTPSGQASVRGSYMMIEIDPETQGAFISCLEGTCALTNLAGNVVMGAGERALLELPEGGEFTLPDIELMSEEDFASWLVFVPEAEEIFPFLDEEGILPFEDWEEFIPEYDEDGILLDGDGTLLDGDGLLPDGGGDNILPDLPDLPDPPELPGNGGGNDLPDLPSGGGTGILG